MIRWNIAVLTSAAIAISYLDRQTLPWAIAAIREDIPISNQLKAALDTAFLVTYGLMYLGGGRLMDRLGTRRGFIVIMLFWSLACASHGLATGVVMLAVSRLLLGVGEGGGFPAATRAVAEWFPVRERSTAMGIINGGTAVGAVVAPPLIALILTRVGWLDLAPWRWVFFLTGALGVLWTIWWWRAYYRPEDHPTLTSAERALVESVPPSGQPEASDDKLIPLKALLAHKETWGVVIAKFLSDAAWYFYLFWLPTFLFDAFGFDIRTASAVGWIPYAASGVGCLVGGGLSSWLLGRGYSVDASRKIALAMSAACMPWVLFVPGLSSVPAVITIFSLAFFGQQSWSTLVMILPTDLIPRRSVGTVAGLVGLGGAMGGVVLGQLAGWLLDHGFSYAPVLWVAGSMHLLAFLVICVMIRRIGPLSFGQPAAQHRG
jgi:ACS family hexuronate transporter-like MFS transporter